MALGVAVTTRARTLTLWCPIDPRTLKPMAVGDDVRERFSTP